MSRIRSIKPEFFSSEQVVECSVLARYMFIGLWTFCDDAGRFPISLKQIKMLIFAGDDIDSTNVRRMIDELSSNGLLELYTVEDKEYLQVTGWHHQRIDRPQPSRYPDTSGKITQTSKRAFDEHSTNVRDGCAHARSDLRPRSRSSTNDPHSTNDRRIETLASPRPLERRASERRVGKAEKGQPGNSASNPSLGHEVELSAGEREARAKAMRALSTEIAGTNVMKVVAADAGNVVSPGSSPVMNGPITPLSAEARKIFGGEP